MNLAFIDDDKEMREIFLLLSQNIPVQVEVFKSLSEFSSSEKFTNYRIIISDFDLGPENGGDLYKSVINNFESPPHFIFFSGNLLAALAAWKSNPLSTVFFVEKPNWEVVCLLVEYLNCCET